MGRCDGKGALSPRRMRHHHITLHDALENAVKWGLLSRNVADTVHPPRCQHPEWHTLSKDDIHTVLESAKKTPFTTYGMVVLPSEHPRQQKDGVW